MLETNATLQEETVESAAVAVADAAAAELSLVT